MASRKPVARGEQVWTVRVSAEVDADVEEYRAKLAKAWGVEHVARQVALVHMLRRAARDAHVKGVQ
jgi:hypothetical protein